MKLKQNTWQLRQNRNWFTKTELKKALKTEPKSNSEYNYRGIIIPNNLLSDFLSLVSQLKSKDNKFAILDNFITQNNLVANEKKGEKMFLFIVAIHHLVIHVSMFQ